MRRNDQNFSLLLISFLAALVIWVLVMNAAKPLVDDFLNIPIEVVVEDNQSIESLGRVFTIADTKNARLRYKVRSDLASQIRLSDVRAYVEVSNIVSNSEYLPVHIEYKNSQVEKNISNVTLYPQVVNVVASDLETRYFDVKYNLSGKLANDASVGNITISPTGISVSGRREDLDNIADAKIEVRLNGQSDTFVDTSNIILYDRNGKHFAINNNIILGNDTAAYTVLVYESKIIKLNTSTEGQVADGCIFNGIDIIPNEITISGPRSYLDEINVLELPAINIQGVSESKDLESIKISDIIPSGLNYQGSDEEIKVHINVEGSANIIIAPKQVEEE